MWTRERTWQRAGANAGRLGEAIVEYQKTLRIKPDDAQAHNGLGWR